ncbi:hypothetical protein B7494_g8250 [Chlorociboria aeruginascens]|nr:hypothetical protein B7494_g8250 [Chlorociboria aeruginascens]
MAYNPYGASPFGRPPGFGGFPGQTGTPPGMGPSPGMGPPPGMSAPGTAPPPGIQQTNATQTGRLSGLPASFQGPTNMPNINFSAPVIRLGTGPAKSSTSLGAGARRESQNEPLSAGGRQGLGMERGVEAQRQALRESMMSLVPPTKEEIVRTIFVGGITEGAAGDEGIERILSTAGRLRRWDRATDADGKQCSFGFAQFEDVESLATAVEVLKDIEIPTKRQPPRSEVKEETKDEEIEKSKLLVFVDDNSLNYLENYQASRGDNGATEQSRLDIARSALKGALYELFHPPMYVKVEEGSDNVTMQDADGNRGDTIEIVNIPLAVDDELADIPADMRETVAQEIAAFRDRSNRRDLERLKREEEMEALERQRNGAPKAPRLASPTSNGPAAGTNNIPLGPRGVPNAPSGPKMQGQQIPRDYQKGVMFVNGSGMNGAASGDVWINREDEDSDASDEELERRRTAKREAELEKQYLDQERRWLNRERSRTAAVQREKDREDEDVAKINVEKEKMASRLREWNDDLESSRKIEEYYSDRSMWIRNRAAFRAREAAADEHDRIAEQREQQRDIVDKEHARGMADSFLERQAEELESRPSRMSIQQPFKLSLGAAAQKAQKAAPPRRTVAEVEGLLEDEEDTSNVSKRTLIPIKFDPSTANATLSDEERDQAVRQLAAEIPTEKEGLWAWNVQWEFVDDVVIVEKLRPFVEKKIMEYLGVQEQLLVEVVEEGIRGRGRPSELVEQLEGALDEEAEVLVKKLWRMVIFFSESEKRGLSA